jgi:hypothetical protein
MNNIITHVNTFNELLSQFITFLENNINCCKSDLILVETTINILKQSNPRLVVLQFMDSIGPYKQEIINCNESFFLDFENNLQKDVLTQDNLLQGMKLKKMWTSDIDEKCKARIFVYFHKLIKIGEKCMV